MASPNSVLGKELFRATAFGKAKRCDRGPHVFEQTCFPHHVGCLLENNTHVWEKSIAALVVALRCLTDNSRTLLFQCKKVVDPCDFSQGRKSQEGEGTVKAASAEKRSENGALTRASAASYFLDPPHEGSADYSDSSLTSTSYRK